MRDPLDLDSIRRRAAAAFVTTIDSSGAHVPRRTTRALASEGEQVIADDVPALLAEVKRLRAALWIGLDQIKWGEHSGRDDEAALQEMMDLSGLRPTPPMAR